MPKRIPKAQVILSREGERVVVPVGKPFDFTADEIAEIEKAAGKRALTKVPAPDEDEDEDAGAADEGKPETEAQRKKREAAEAKAAAAKAKEEDL